jgi:hypothetical protein
VWALPVLTALCPSERYHRQRKQRHKTLPEWAGQVLKRLQRWLPGREVVVLADSSYAVLELRHQVQAQGGLSLIPRLRLDAALYDPAPARKPGQTGRPRKKGARRPTLHHVLTDPHTRWTPMTVKGWYGGGTREVEICTDTAVWYHAGLPPVAIRWVLIRDPQHAFAPQALLTTCLSHPPHQIVAWFVRRWQMEVTFAEARAHLGVETQRQWNDWAIGRTTPALFGLYSLVTLMAHDFFQANGHVFRTATWYVKRRPTFSDALAVIRRELWHTCHFSMSAFTDELVKIPRSVFERLTDAVCYAA